MELFNYNVPSANINQAFNKYDTDYSKVVAGSFVRNAVLSGATYGGSDLAPAYIKTRDVIHPLYDYMDQLGNSSSIYGGCGASVDLNNAKSILNPQNTYTWWNIGSTADASAGAYVYMKLPEATIAGSWQIGGKLSTIPYSYTLSGSNDGITYTDIQTIDSTGTDWDTTYSEKLYTIPDDKQAPYSYYKLTINSSTATTPSLRSFRVFRKNSVCDKGQILFACKDTPLLLSFANGFDTNGLPIDENGEISTDIIYNIDITDTKFSTLTVPASFNINAVKDNNNISIELENASGNQIIQANGGMKSISDKGWVCNTTSSLANLCYQSFGSNIQSYYGDVTNWLEFTITRQDGQSVFVSKINVRNYYYYGSSTLPLSVIELSGKKTQLNDSIIGDTKDFIINRRILGIHSYMGSYYHNGGVLLYSPSAPSYRFVNGKLYKRESPVDSFVECQKIRLGTCVLSPIFTNNVLTSFEVFQADARVSSQLGWMLNGNYSSYLDA